MASIHKRGKGYYVRWRNRGEAKNYSWSCPDKKTAEEIRLQADIAYARGERYTGPQVEAPPTVTLEQLAIRYLEDRKRLRTSGSIYQTDIALTQFLNFMGARTEPRELSRTALTDFHTHLRTERKMGISTANSRVRAVLFWWRWLEDQEDLDALVPRARNVELPSAVPPPPPVAPTWEEMDRFAAHASGWYVHLGIALRFTGLRTTQVLRLRRADIDTERHTMTVRGELGKTQQERQGRVVPISPHLSALVKEWPLDPDGWLISILPMPGWHGVERPHRIACNPTARRTWHRAGVRPEVWQTKTPDSQGRHHGHPLHCFRAGFVSNLLAAGAQEEDVQFLVGHAGRTVTAQRYTDQGMVRKLSETVALIPPLSVVTQNRLSSGAVPSLFTPERRKK